ncbi:MAG: peptidase [Frankia sp.]
MRRVLLTLALLVAGTTVPATTVNSAPARAADDPGTIGVGLLDAPSSLRDDPRAQQYIIDHLPPGAIIHRHVKIANNTPHTQRFTTYPGAATISGGVFKFASRHTPNELATWTTLDHTSLSIPPESDAVVTVTITVPRDASPGERYGVIWAETAGPTTGGSLHLVNLVGIRIYLDIGPGGPPASNFTITSLTAKRLPDGHPAITAQVHNTGGRALDLAGTMNLADGPGGLNAGPFRTTLGTTLAPTQSEPVTVTLDRQLPDGPWKAVLTLHSGLIYKTIHVTIRFPHDTGTAHAVTISTMGSRYTTVALLTGGTIGLVAIIALLLGLRRRRRPSQT